MRGPISVRPICAVLIALSFTWLSSSVPAKCSTERIEISGESLGRTIRISDADIAGRYFVYNGPGVRVSGQPVHMDPDNQAGNFIYWPAGAADDLRAVGEIFAVSFWCAYNGKPEVIYEIDYRFRIGDEGGYIFLPGEGDSRYRRNVSTIVHGVEGRWFHSTDDWERTIRPIIEKAIRKQVAALSEG